MVTNAYANGLEPPPWPQVPRTPPEYSRMLRIPITPSGPGRYMDPAPFMGAFGQLKYMIEAKRPVFTGLHNRQKADNDMYNLVRFDGEEHFGSLRDKGLRAFTSNEPRVYAKKLQAFAEDAVLNIKIPTSRENEQQRILNQHKLDVANSMLKLVDKRLNKYGLGDLRSQLAHHTTVRGWLTGRCLLRSNPATGETVLDVTPWDPMNVVWNDGPDGLEWACNITYMTPAEIRAYYPDSRPFTFDELLTEHRVLVYEYYDATHTAVFSDTYEIKPPVRHGAQEIPVYRIPVGGESTSYGTDISATLEYMGESCYDSVRDLYRELNHVLSMIKQNVTRGGNVSYIVIAQDGKAKLMHNPFTKEGSEVTLRPGESIEALPYPVLPVEIGEFLTYILGSIQRGSIPFSNYGEIGSALSGYAIDTLNQGMKSKVDPIIKAVTRAYEQIVEKLIRQYSTGFFAPIPVMGDGDDLPPMVLGFADDLNFMMNANLPQDLPANISAAQMAREPGEFGSPLYSDDWIREHIMQSSDEEGVQTLIDAQMARRTGDAAAYLSYFQAALERGDLDTAREQLMNYIIAREEKDLNLMVLRLQVAQMLMLGVPPSGVPSAVDGGGGSGTPASPGISNSIRPQQVLGQPNQPLPFQQSGPLVAPGTPRPGGAQTS